MSLGLFHFPWTDFDFISPNSKAKLAFVSLTKESQPRKRWWTMRSLLKISVGKTEDRGKLPMTHENPFKSFSSPFLSLPSSLWPMKELSFVIIGTQHPHHHQIRCTKLNEPKQEVRLAVYRAALRKEKVHSGPQAELWLEGSAPAQHQLSTSWQRLGRSRSWGVGGSQECGAGGWTVEPSRTSAPEIGNTGVQPLQSGKVIALSPNFSSLMSSHPSLSKQNPHSSPVSTLPGTH